MGEAAIVVHRDIVGIEPRRLVEILDGSRGVTQGAAKNLRSAPRLLYRIAEGLRLCPIIPVATLKRMSGPSNTAAPGVSMLEA